MPIISTQNLHDSFVAKYNIGANRIPKFTSAFLGAYNDALMDLYNATALSTEPTVLTALNEDSTLTERYLAIIKVGIRFHLQDAGEWVQGDAIDQWAELKWKRRLGEACDMKARVNPWGDTQ